MMSRRSALYRAFNVFERTPFWKPFLQRHVAANVLMFHRVNDFDSDPLTTPTPVFREMMRTLKEHYRIISLRELVGTLRGRGKFDGTTVVITFDDGYKDNFSVAAPILKELGIPATFFVTSGYIGTARRFPWDGDNPSPNVLMTWDEVRELDKMGFEVGSHTVNHPDMGVASIEGARRELRQSKEHIESELGKRVLSFAFPFGRRENCSPAVAEIAREEGYACCCNGYGGKVTERSNVYSLHRIPAYPNPIETRMEVENFVTYFDGTTRVAGIRVP